MSQLHQLSWNLDVVVSFSKICHPAPIILSVCTVEGLRVCVWGGGGSGSEWGFVEAGLECVLRGLRSMWVGVMGMCKDKLKVNCISNNMLHMFSAEVLQWVYLLT